ncbi:MAG: hypothetical protein FWC71_02475 [Defluviitaleaceae bacterium]|nr:hypothetical protein [Defluviitaleaceae bacterium]
MDNEARMFNFKYTRHRILPFVLYAILLLVFANIAMLIWPNTQITISDIVTRQIANPISGRAVLISIPVLWIIINDCFARKGKASEMIAPETISK